MLSWRLVSLQDASVARLMKDSKSLEKAYRHWFDLVIVNNDIEQTIETLLQAVSTANSSPQWIPVSWVYWSYPLQVCITNGNSHLPWEWQLLRRNGSEKPVAAELYNVLLSYGHVQVSNCAVNCIIKTIILCVYSRCCVVSRIHAFTHWTTVTDLSLIHIWRCRRSTLCRSRWSPYH